MAGFLKNRFPISFPSPGPRFEGATLIEPTYFFNYSETSQGVCVCSLHRPHLHVQIAEYVSVFWGTGEDEGKFMRVPVSPGGQDPLDIATTLPLLNQGSGGGGSLFFWPANLLYSPQLCTPTGKGGQARVSSSHWPNNHGLSVSVRNGPVQRCPSLVPPKARFQLRLGTAFLPQSHNLLMTQFPSQSPG